MVWRCLSSRNDPRWVHQHLKPFSELCSYHMGHPTSAKGMIVPMWHRLAKAVLYLYHTARPRSITHSSPYHIYHLPIWVMHLNTFDMEHTIYVQDSFFNVNSMVMFVSWSDYLISQLFQECWYGAYHICLGLIFQYKFNGDVCFVIGLPYFVILTNAIIGVSKTTSVYSIWYISGLLFLSRIWIWSQNVNISFVSYVRIWFV